MTTFQDSTTSQWWHTEEIVEARTYDPKSIETSKAPDLFMAVVCCWAAKDPVARSIWFFEILGCCSVKVVGTKPGMYKNHKGIIVNLEV